ncbi:MAG: helix-turn-helix domain-containing protein [Terracidiphilus sp.]
MGKHAPFNPEIHAWATAAQAAEYLQVNPLTLHRWIREGKLQATKTAVGGRYRIPAAALVEYFNQPPEGGKRDEH